MKTETAIITKLTPEAKSIMREAVDRIVQRALNPVKNKPQLDMKVWARSEGEMVSTVGQLCSVEKAHCNTAMCFYGDIALMHCDKLNRAGYIAEEVSKLLGLDVTEAQALYSTDYWKEEFDEAYGNAEVSGDELGMALALRDNVEWFISEREWL